MFANNAGHRRSVEEFELRERRRRQQILHQISRLPQPLMNRNAEPLFRRIGDSNAATAVRLVRGVRAYRDRPSHTSTCQEGSAQTPLPTEPETALELQDRAPCSCDHSSQDVVRKVLADVHTLQLAQGSGGGRRILSQKISKRGADRWPILFMDQLRGLIR